MVNWKVALKSLGVLTVGAVGGIVQTVAPVLAGNYNDDATGIVTTAIFVILTVIGIKQTNRAYENGDL